jgi:hypothetical protein
MSSRIAFLFVVGRAAIAGISIPLTLSLSNAACSSNSSAGDAGSGTSADTACTDSAHSACTKMQSCTPANLQATYGDEPTCEVRVKAVCLDSLAAPSTGSSADKTETCAQAYGSYACTDYRNKTNIPVACQQPTGSVMNGNKCLYPAQCQSGFCAIVPGSACGACANMPKQGDSCAQLTSCGPTLTCTTDTLVCTTLAGQNQACGMGQPCGAGLSCVASGGAGTAGMCQSAGSQAGTACDGSLKTGPNCDGPLGLYCNGVTKQCAQTTYASATQPCGYDVPNGTLVGCTSGTCEGADASKGQLGQCAGRAADNGSCGVPDGGASTPSKGCLPSARCIAQNAASATCQMVTASNCK